MVRKRNRYPLDKRRVIAYLDVDCFSVQIARRLLPNLKGQPCATIRTHDSPIISVSCEALNVCKGIYDSEAIQICPDITILTEDEMQGFKEEKEKMSQNLFNIIKKFCGNDITIQMTSIDDLFLDLTDKCDQFLEEKFIYDQKFLQSLDVVIEGGVRQLSFGQTKDYHRLKWAEAAVIITNLCDQILDKTGLICSVGISVNKLLAKIGCKRNKPNKITIIAAKTGVDRVFASSPISIVDRLGSGFGYAVRQRLKISTLKELRTFRRRDLIRMFGKNKGKFLWDVCRGIDSKPVKYKIEFKTLSFEEEYPQGINCENKKLFEDLYLKSELLADKMNGDLQQNQRIAHRIRIEVYTRNGRNLSTTFYLMSKFYDSKEIYDTINAKNFPYISKDVPQYISGFNIIPIDFKPIQNLEGVRDLTHQLAKMKI